MPRTALPITVVDRTGAIVQPAQTVADVGNGNYIPGNDGRIFCEINNTGGSTYTVTFQIPGTQDGVAAANAGKQLSLAPAADIVVGPFPPLVYNQPDQSISIDTQNAAVKFRVYHV